MEKEILDRGYITHALTTSKNDILGLIKDHRINFNESSDTYYWSEVYCESGYMAHIIRKGQILLNATPEELNAKFEQSKVNLG